MITIPTYQMTLPVVIDQPSSNYNGLGRLFAAAVVNKQFCQTLLDHPVQALEDGYQGETFLFTIEERDTLLSIRAASLPDLAKQVTHALSKNTYLMQQTYHV